MATLLEQLLSLAAAGTMMISSALTTAAPQNDINGLLFLQNRQWRVSAAYIPEVREAQISGKVRNMRADAAAALEEMCAACVAETGRELIAVSGYRSYQTQATIYENKLKSVDGSRARADEYVARAGASEHQLGMAMDLGWEDDPTTSPDFAYATAGAWATDNCWRFGFILRYQAEWEKITGYKHEAWHFRYVGKENARRIHENEMPLESYLILLRQETLMEIVMGDDAQ